MRTEWDVAGNCTAPRHLVLQARPTSAEVIVHTTIFDELRIGSSGKTRHKVTAPFRFAPRMVTVAPGRPFPLVLECWIRCRRCDRCRAAKARLWRHRAIEETRVWPRTWFGTLTVNPEQHHLFWLQALKASADKGVDLDACSFAERFNARNRQISVELTKMLKRIREKSRAPLRYLLVCEQHKSGLPHHHMLLHECDVALPVRHKLLAVEWPHGFTKWRLVNTEAEATYLCKYIAKSGVARVRASLRYGDALGHSVKREKPLDLPTPNQMGSAQGVGTDHYVGTALAGSPQARGS